jgi:DNA-binding helix-hairpin-helix protein with protein kinase domain
MSPQAVGGGAITPTTRLGSGGEADVFAIAEDTSLAFKRYFEVKRLETQRTKLETMIANPPSDPTQ